jgi:O-antigen/teichoic acid export membrane protein
LTRKLDFKSQSLLDLSSSVVGSLTTLGLAMTGFGVWALVWGNLAITTWRTVGLNLISPFAHWPRFSIKGTRALLSFGGNFTVTRIVWFFYSQADVLIAGKIFGKELLGIYSVAMDLAGLPVKKISSVINQISFPAFARVQDDRDKFASHFLLATRAMSFVAFPALWGVSCTAPELVRVLLGTNWEAAALPMQLLALIMPVYMMTPFMVTAAQGMGRADIALKQVLPASIVMPIAFLIGSQWGIVGLSLAWVVAFPFVFLGALLTFLPLIKLRIHDMLAAMARPALAALGMYIVVTLARETIAPETHIVIQLSVLVITGAMTYGALVVAINRQGCREIIDLLKG